MTEAFELADQRGNLEEVLYVLEYEAGTQITDTERELILQTIVLVKQCIENLLGLEKAMGG